MRSHRRAAWGQAAAPHPGAARTHAPAAPPLTEAAAHDVRRCSARSRFVYLFVINFTRSRVIFLCQHRPDDQIEVELTDADFALTAAEAAATYKELKAFVKARYGFKITSLYISQVKRKCGLPVGECYYHPKNLNPVIPQCPPEKEAAIREALEHFQMLSPVVPPTNL